MNLPVLECRSFLFCTKLYIDVDKFPLKVENERYSNFCWEICLESFTWQFNLFTLTCIFLSANFKGIFVTSRCTYTVHMANNFWHIQCFYIDHCTREDDQYVVLQTQPFKVYQAHSGYEITWVLVCTCTTLSV